MRNALCLTLIGSLLAVSGCGGAYASRARTRYVASHGHIPLAEEIRVDDFLADYRESFVDPTPYAAGLTVEGAHAMWATEDAERLFVVQTGVRARNADVRPPVALMFVVDRSGSMADEDKMTFVREALHRVINQLDPRDMIGITAFDNRAESVLPMTTIGERAGTIHGAIDRLYPRGSTNLSEGLAEGYRHLDAIEGGYLRRVILLTDAMANVGQTDLASISGYAARGDARGIRLSAIGVGLAHRDDVLVSMTEAGRGNHHFLDEPARISRVFEDELAGLVEDVADSLVLTFVPAPGVSVVRVEGADDAMQGSEHTVDLGRLGASQHRVVLWTLRGVSPHDRTPDVGEFRLAFTDMRSGEPMRLIHRAPVFAVRDAAEGTVARNAAVAWMANDLRHISRLAHGGRVREARRRLQHVRAVIDAVAAQRPEDEELARDRQMLSDMARTLGPIEPQIEADWRYEG